MNDGASDGASMQPFGDGAPEPEPELGPKLEPEAHPEPAPARRARLEPQRYKVQFEASEEYVGLVERAKALLSHAAPRTDLGELHLRAMRALVAELERKKYAVTARPRQRVSASSLPQAAADAAQERLGAGRPTDAREVAPPAAASKPEHPRRRGRHVPAAIRRAVFERDQKRCTYRSDSGERCRETKRLELHHLLLPFARGGEHSLDNVTLRCRAHNTLAAEQDFGSAFVARARDSNQHEPWAAHDVLPRASPPTGFR